MKMFLTVFLGVLAALAAMKLISFGMILALISSIGNMFGGNGNFKQLAKPVRGFTQIQAIDGLGANTMKAMEETRYLQENPDIRDMPPREHENKWNKISKGNLTCWYHKKSMKKVCE